jgi:hypothetical protein
MIFLQVWGIGSLVLLVIGLFMMAGAFADAYVNNPKPREVAWVFLAFTFWPISIVVWIVGAIVHNDWKWFDK